MTGVVKLAPVLISVPSVEVVYHLSCPADAVAPKVTEPGPQRSLSALPVTVGVGITVMVKVTGDPVQVVVSGVTVIVALIDVVVEVEVDAVNEAILPVPPAADKPMPVLLFVQ